MGKLAERLFGAFVNVALAGVVVTWNPALLVGGLIYGLTITSWDKGARDLGAARAQVIFAAGPFIGVATGEEVGGHIVGGDRRRPAQRERRGVAGQQRAGSRVGFPARQRERREPVLQLVV